MRIPNQIIILSTVLCLALCAACEKESINDDIILKDKEVHFDEFAQNLESAFFPGCVGFQYTISQNGQFVTQNALGHAILEIDGPLTEYSDTHRKSTHSMAKTITAAAMLKALNSHGIDLDDFIAPYLPDRWELSTEVDDITFRQLLTHTSGLRGTKDSYNSMQTYMEAGGFESKTGTYANVNFTLMRILIPMTSPIVNPALNDVLNTEGGEAFDLLVSEGYIAYVRNTVLIPAGLDEKIGPYIWDGPEEEASRNYNYADQTINGYTHPDQTLLTGAGGWYMNTHDYSAFLAFLLHGQLEGIDEQLMIDGNLGLYNTFYGSQNYYTHNGAINTADNRGGRGIWIHLPATDVTVVVQVNSAENDWTLAEMPGMIIEAYQDSYY